jgi:YidC/Oxa1 family membrane protein insertase
VPLTWTDAQGRTVTKTFTFKRGNYRIGIDYDIRNPTQAQWKVAPYVRFLRHQEPVDRSMWDVASYAFMGPAIYDGKRYLKLDIEDEEDARFTAKVSDGWLAAMQHHFVAAAVPLAGEPYQYRLEVKDRDYLLSAVGPAKVVPAGGEQRISETVFVGPKLQKQLEATGPELDRTADYGKLTIISKPLFQLLNWIYAAVGNWGWAIVIVTFLLKLVFYPLSETSGRSMAKMRTLAPRIKSLQERYKDNREQLARAMMDIYKREKINPAAGCLPMIVQIPVFLAFYWVLLESVEMRQAPFMLWINDLSSRDPFFVLPLLMGAAMFGQFKLNPAPPDPMQAKVFMFMPVVMTVMFAFFPAGLVLYWLTNTLLSIAQQWNINRRIEKAAAAKKS